MTMPSSATAASDTSAAAPSATTGSASSTPTPTSNSKKTSFWGRHRRRHIRNETLTIVWNYATSVVKSWLGKAEEAGVAETHRFRLLRILYGDYDGKPFPETTTTTDINAEDTTRDAANSSVALEGGEEENPTTSQQTTIELSRLEEGAGRNDVLVID